MFSLPLGSDSRVRLSDVPSFVDRRRRQRHLHRSAATDADAEADTDDAAGKDFKQTSVYANDGLGDLKEKRDRKIMIEIVFLRFDDDV